MKKTLVIIIGLASLIFIAALYFRQKFDDRGLSVTKGASNLKQMVDSGQIRNGDLIFQTSQSRQSKAIQLATRSRYSHCGIIYKNGSEFYVFEAVQPVKLTPLEVWVARGEKGKYVIKRLKDAAHILTSATLIKMQNVGAELAGKDYDLAFEWSDDRIYCSELIWKIYQRATGVEIGALQKLSDFDLSNTEVRQKLKERYGNNIPANEIVISPAAIFDCNLLVTIKSNY